MSRARAFVLRELDREQEVRESDPAQAQARAQATALAQAQAQAQAKPRSGKILKILFLVAGAGAAWWILSSDRPRSPDQPSLPPASPDPASTEGEGGDRQIGQGQDRGHGDPA